MESIVGDIGSYIKPVGHLVTLYSETSHIISVNDLGLCGIEIRGMRKSAFKSDQKLFLVSFTFINGLFGYLEKPLNS